LTDGGITLQDQVTITVRALPDVNLGEDVAVCEGGEAVLDAGTGFSSYLWSTGATGSTISVSQPGSYWVEVANQYGCSSRDTVEFSNYPLPVVSLGADKNFCEGTSVMLDAGTGFSTYVWSTGENSYYINATQPGDYWVTVTDANGCSDTDTISLAMDPLPVATTVSSGPVTVDNFLSPSSDFTCIEAANATSYEWRLEPAEAGSISGDGTGAQVTWTAGYTGTANISVRSNNDCGNSAYSPAYSVSVYSSQGIDESMAISGMKLFPNPNDGIFTVQFTSGKEQTMQFHVTTSGGARVIESLETLATGPFQKTFNMDRLPAGTYYLVILDKDGKMVSRQQVIVK
jgi:hypothetical protein